jgi:hypothetical protein
MQPHSDYIAHLLRELGRLGLETSDIERHERPPNTKTVLSDLMKWLSERPAEALAKLFNWQALDLSRIRSRLEQDRSAKPRIEVSAHITKMNNLSVRWHPGGWRNTDFNRDRSDRNHFNLITQRKWRQLPDFHWFVGDEDPTFDSRPSNEFMYIRGAGNLRPVPREAYGPYATYNTDVVDSILICAVRSAYESLIDELEHSFEVDMVDTFEFTTRDEMDESDPSPYRSSIHRVVAWSLVDAAELRARREREAVTEQDKRDRAELADVTVTHGFGLEEFVAALVLASTKKSAGPAPSGENTDRNAAKQLRNTGFKVDAADVRRIRRLIERYNAEILPEPLRPAPPAAPVPSPNKNVIRFPASDQ